MVHATFKDSVTANYNLAVGKWTSSDMALEEKLNFLTTNAIKYHERYIPDYEVFVGNYVQSLWKDAKVKVVSSAKPSTAKTGDLD